MVAIKGPSITSFLRVPDPRYSAILLFGPDAGLVSERAAGLAKAVAAREKPPGEIVRIDDTDLESDPDRLAVELQTMPMFGGRKVIRAVAGRRINAQYLKPMIEAGQLAATLIVEAGNLKADEGVRGLFEKSPSSAAVGCYPDEERDLGALVNEVLSAAKLDIAQDAKELLVARLGADRALSRNEVEKLTLYVHGKGRVDVDDIEAVVGDAAELALDTVIKAAVDGDMKRALVELDRTVSAGESAQELVILLQRYVQRLHRVRAAVEAGRSIDDVMRAMRPPVFGKQKDALAAHCRAWTLSRLDEAQARIAKAAKDARLGRDLEQIMVERLLIEVSRLARLAAADQKRGR